MLVTKLRTCAKRVAGTADVRISNFASAFARIRREVMRAVSFEIAATVVYVTAICKDDGRNTCI
jgi:hypothetical protein